MVFSSAVFVFAFLPIVLIGYYVVQSRYRNALLLVASLLFYAYGEPKFVFVMLASILFNYGFALLIDYSNNRRVRKLVLWCAVLVNLGLLFEYKYFGFAQNILNKVLGGMVFSWPVPELPIGISFLPFKRYPMFWMCTLVGQPCRKIPFT